ncbi:leucine-rich repeat and transmembrane domain-containing protein 2-like [Sardina pilchardus]|uniref:leucine-rich repeat and transmembrane domain-containing protein 2-like n=1 Tax=Sardina pilchardus TaxID=27697 RepID=UPI002E1421FB
MGPLDPHSGMDQLNPFTLIKPPQPPMDSSARHALAGGCPGTCVCAGTDAVCNDQGIASLRYMMDQLPRDICVLQLSRNNLSALEPGVFSSIASLQSLDLSSNNISVLHVRAFANLSRLERLDLSSNPVLSLPVGIFGELGRLTELVLSDTSLRALGADLFQGLTQLRRLDLSLNRLTALPRGLLGGLQELTWLSLAANGLRSVQRAQFEPLAELQSLLLVGNPWECDCTLVEFKHWLEWMLYRGGQVDALECSLPKELWGRDIRAVPAEMFSHCTRDSSLPCSRAADGQEPGGDDGAGDCVRQRYRAVSVRRAAATVVVAGVVCGVVCVMMVVAATYGCVYASLAAKYQREKKGKAHKPPADGGEEKDPEQEEKSELLPDVARETEVPTPTVEVVLSREVCV